MSGNTLGHFHQDYLAIIKKKKKKKKKPSYRSRGLQRPPALIILLHWPVVHIHAIQAAEEKKKIFFWAYFYGFVVQCSCANCRLWWAGLRPCQFIPVLKTQVSRLPAIRIPREMTGHGKSTTTNTLCFKFYLCSGRAHLASFLFIIYFWYHI